MTAIWALETPENNLGFDTLSSLIDSDPVVWTTAHRLIEWKAGDAEKARHWLDGVIHRNFIEGSL